MITTLNTIDYYERLVASQTRDGRHDDGKRKESLHRTQEFARLFLQPGVAHCTGGAGPDAMDFLTPLVQWVEQVLRRTRSSRPKSLMV
jgi:feruloyl esterase